MASQQKRVLPTPDGADLADDDGRGGRRAVVLEVHGRRLAGVGEVVLEGGGGALGASCHRDGLHDAGSPFGCPCGPGVALALHNPAWLTGVCSVGCRTERSSCYREVLRKGAHREI